MIFENRVDAGRRLAEQLQHHRSARPVVLALLRGGVAVGYEVAQALHAPLDIVFARKVSAPGRPEDSIGAVAPGVTYLDAPLIRQLGIGARYIELTIAEEVRVMELQRETFQKNRSPIELDGRTAILVDDGAASGATAAAAIEHVRKRNPAMLIFAAPVCAPQAVALLREMAEDVVYLAAPGDFGAVSKYYRDFTPVADEEVLDILERC